MCYALKKDIFDPEFGMGNVMEYQIGSWEARVQVLAPL